MNNRVNIPTDFLPRLTGIPNPPQTHLLQTALAKGCKTVNGLRMLINQGVIGIKYWTGIEVDPVIMHDELKRVLNIK